MKSHFRIVLIFIISFTLLLSCKVKKNTQTDVIKNQKEQYPQAVIGSFSKGSDPIKILSVRLDRNFLELEVSYSGGCALHDFKLIGSEFLSKSLPPIRNVQLVHDKKGDTCKRKVTEKIKFAISSLAENTNSGNKINLQIEGYKEVISYTYE